MNILKCTSLIILLGSQILWLMAFAQSGVWVVSQTSTQLAWPSWNVSAVWTTNSSTQPISSVGIDCRPDQMTNGTCSLSVYKLLWIRQSTPNPNPGILINDLVLSATFFIGTVATLAIIYSWFMLVRNNATGNSEDRTKARNNIINALIGIALVSLSYTIIRLIQYLAAG